MAIASSSLVIPCIAVFGEIAAEALFELV